MSDVLEKKVTCSCPEHPWRFYKAGEGVTNADGDVSQPFLCDVWERMDDDIGLCTSQFALEEDGYFYCDRCGTCCTGRGTTEAQVPWARVVQAEKRMAEVQAHLDSCRPDANLFSMVRSIIAFSKGIFLLKDGDRIVLGEPTETICYAKLGEGCDEREAVRVAYENMLNVAPCDRERGEI